MNKLNVIKHRTWEVLENTKEDDKSGRLDDILIMTLIFLNVLAVIIGTVQSIQQKYGTYLDAFEVFSVVIFTIEYILRIWACTQEKKYTRPILGRLRYMRTPMLIVDLIAILPFYLPFLGVDLRIVRMLRLLRIFRIVKAARYISSLKLLGRVFRAKKEELIITSAVMLLLVVLASSLMYYVENGAQPDKFTDIPTTMWWAISTLTTVGYGDIFPITALGKFLASIVAIMGIGLFALPTGILGAGFVEEFQKSKTKADHKVCPHCGKKINF